MNNDKNKFVLSQQEKKIVALAALGGLFEFYDFVIYGIFSVYFVHQFFPNQNPILSIIQSYVVFILGYIARPIGGILFSHIGDEHGRKKVLIITIILMGASSLGIGLLPTYQQIGVIAPLSLLILRLLQGLALGGELPSTYVYISETMPHKRGSGFGITMLGVNSGLLLGMLINQLLNMYLSTEQLNSFGWRIPFIFGGIVCLVSYAIRKSLQETAAFNKIHDKPRFPLIYLFKHHLREVLIGIALTAIMSAAVVVAIIFMPTYLHQIVKLDNHTISYGMTAALICNSVTIYFCGKLANRISPVTILSCALLLGFLLIPFCYWIISSKHVIFIGSLILLCIFQGISAMLVPLLISSIFPAKIRLTGVAFCYNIGFTLFGGLAPVVISALINAGTNIYLTPVFYLLTAVTVSGLGLIFMKKQ